MEMPTWKEAQQHRVVAQGEQILQAVWYPSVWRSTAYHGWRLHATGHQLRHSEIVQRDGECEAGPASKDHGREDTEVCGKIEGTIDT